MIENWGTGPRRAQDAATGVPDHTFFGGRLQPYCLFYYSLAVGLGQKVRTCVHFRTPTGLERFGKKQSLKAG